MSASATATRPSAVPGNVRGFSALHSKYGRLRWAQVVAPAANMARFGVPVSRAFARDLAKVEKALLMEPETRTHRDRVEALGRSVFGPAHVQTELRNLPPMRIYRFDKPVATA